MEKEKSVQAMSINEIFVSVLLLVSMLVLVDLEVAGMRVCILLLFIMSFIYICYGMIFGRNEDSFVLRPRNRVDRFVLALLFWNLLSIIGKLFQDPELGAIDYRFQVTCIVFSFLYFIYKKINKFHDWYFDLIIYSGLLVMGAMLFCYLCDVQPTGILSEIMNDPGKCASYLLLPCAASVCRYSTCKDKRGSVFYLLTAVVGFFTLIINNNVISFWLMATVFFAAPVLMRPIAEFIKRDMQLCFIFFFMLSNMSLLMNYTHLIQKEINLSFEHSVYIDLLIALGGVFFFSYWDKIPKDVDRDKLIMIKMGRGYASVLLMTEIVFLSFVTGGNRWKGLPDTMVATIVKSFAIPLIDEIGKNKNAWFYCMENSSISTFLLIFLATLLTGRIIKNYSHDKPLTGSFLIITIMIFTETFFLVPSCNILPVYLLILVMAAFYREKEQPVIVTKLNYQKESANK